MDGATGSHLGWGNRDSEDRPDVEWGNHSSGWVSYLSITDLDGLMPRLIRDTMGMEREGVMSGKSTTFFASIRLKFTTKSGKEFERVARRLTRKITKVLHLPKEVAVDVSLDGAITPNGGTVRFHN